jgi:aryl-alcohol dehydrogenase
MALAQPAGSTVSPLSAGVEAGYVAPPAVASRSSARLELASELGATDTVNQADGDRVSALLELTGGLGAQYAVETSGRLAVLGQAIFQGLLLG